VVPPTRVRVIPALALIALATARPARAQATIEGLGLPPGATYISDLRLSGDGTTLFGGCDQPAGPDGWGRAWRWTRETGIVLLPAYHPGATSSLEVRGTNYDGTVMVGDAWCSDNPSICGYWAFRWTLAGGFQALWPEFEVAYAVSGNGNIVVGVGPHGGYRWHADSGWFEPLPAMDGFYGPYLGRCSADADVIVGTAIEILTSRYQAARWTPDAGWHGLGFVQGTGPSYATEVSADGTTVFGNATWDVGQAFRWTAARGLRLLGPAPLPAPIAVYVTGVSANGAVAVGYATDFRTRNVPFLWDHRHGVRALREVLERQYGVDLTDWSLVKAASLSWDGRIVAGSGRWREAPQPWVATLPPLCEADWDDDGRITIRDFFAYLTDFAAGNETADLDDNGAPDIRDFLRFLSLYAAGCAR
jgi:hypothetical protein